jgi:hypothetical protein
MDRELTFRSALLIYAVLFFALIHPFWMFGEVVAPYPLAAETGPPRTPSVYIENGKFFDYWHFFIPEIQAHMQAPRSGWLALWTSSNELGRPLYHGGFSGAYFPMWVLANITDNPARLLTLTSLGLCFLAGLFLMLLCKELSLAPLAGLIAGGSVAAAPLMMYWLTFPMFLAVVCWSAGALYALTRMARRIDLPGGAVLAFSCYSLMMTAFPQSVVFHAYVLTGYLLWALQRCRKSAGTAAAIRYLGAVAVSGVGGILLAAPNILDIAGTASRSSRLAADTSFFMAMLPTIDSIATLMRTFSTGTFPELIANPVSPSFPLPYDGMSITPVILFLALFSLLRCPRETWGWWLAIVIVCVFAFVHPLYAFGVRHLGFNLSSDNPLDTLLLPLAIISAYGVNALTAQSPFRTGAVKLSILGTTVSLIAVLCFYWTDGMNIRWDIAAAMLAVILLLAGCLVGSLRPFALIAALVLTGACTAFPLMLRRPVTDLIQNSDLVKRVIAATPAGTRIALIAPGADVLLPNANSIFGIASVHSYDSLSSRRYQALLRELGGETEQYGRWNSMIAPDFGSHIFWMSNIGLVISPTPILHPNLERFGVEGTLQLYRVRDSMGCCLQSPTATNAGPDGISSTTREGVRPVKTTDQGDLLEFEVHNYPDTESVLTLSQQYHNDWRASVRTASGWQVARTVPVNGVFQGVVIPAKSQLIRLQFMPFIRFAWIAHVVWVIVILVAVPGRYRQRRLPGWPAGRHTGCSSTGFTGR